MQREYTEESVWRALIGVAGVTKEEEMDMQQAMSKLSYPDQCFLLFISRGYNTGLALHLAGLEGNQTRHKQRILHQFTDILNGGQQNGNQDCPGEHGATER